MASIRADGHEVPLLLPLGEGGFAIVSSHLFHVRFGFIQSRGGHSPRFSNLRVAEKVKQVKHLKI